MRVFYLLSFLLFATCGYATTFYISPKGNDVAGNGSFNAPWQSLFKATSSLKVPGDIIHVLPGTYTENAKCELNVGISIEGEGNTSIIKSSLLADWTGILSLISAEGTNGNQHISNLKFDGQNLSTFWAIYVAGRSNVSIYNCTIIDFRDRGVVFNGRNDNTPAAPTNFATGNSFHDNYVNNCAAYNTSAGKYGRGALNIGGQDGMLIYNDTIIQNSRPTGYNGWPIKYSDEGYLKGIKIYNNLLIKIPYKGDFPGDDGWDFAIEFWNILGGMEIHGNTIQGAIDLVNTSKNSYPYGVWFHDNKVAQKNLNSSYESGVIFEVNTESCIVENNVFDKLSGGVLFNAQEGTEINDIIIRNNTFSNIGRNLGNNNNGNGISFKCGTLFGDEHHYTLNNLLIFNNKISAAKNNAPLYGIEINGAAAAKNIKIQNNTINDFRISCFTANPGYAVDGLTIEKNIFTGNGCGNDPFYISGNPSDYYVAKNTKNNAVSGSDPGFSFREQLIRPLYYDFKRSSIIELILLLAGLISIWFSRKENIYVFPMSTIISLVYIASNILDDWFPANACIGLYFLIMSIYGWRVWAMRDVRRHRVVRITDSSKKEKQIQLVVFASFFILLFVMLQYFKKNFTPGTIPWADALVYAAAFTGMWLMTRKKLESWYWWIAAIALSVPLCFIKHYLLISIYFVPALAMSYWALRRWRRKRIVRKKKIYART